MNCMCQGAKNSVLLYDYVHFEGGHIDIFVLAG